MIAPNRKPKRERDPAYLVFVRGLPCVACACEGRTSLPGSVDAAHVSFLGNKGFGSKVSDRLAVPLCREHHDEQHSGNERIWWARLGINAGSLIRELGESFPDHVAGEVVIMGYAIGSHRTHRLQTAGELREAADAAPRRVTVTGYVSDSRDADGNQGILLPILDARGSATTLVHVDPSAIADGASYSGSGR